MDEHRPRNIFLIQIQIKYIPLTGKTERTLLQKQSLHALEKCIPYLNTKKKWKEKKKGIYSGIQKITEDTLHLKIPFPQKWVGVLTDLFLKKMPMSLKATWLPDLHVILDDIAVPVISNDIRD